jgi:hypothetical protein
MKAVGILLAVAGIVVMVVQTVMGITTYHMNRPHDTHKFIVWMAVGLVIAIIGGLMVRQSDQ